MSRGGAGGGEHDALVPFPTRLLAEYGDVPVPVAGYSAAVAALGACDLAPAAVLAKRPWLRDGTRSDTSSTPYLLESATPVVVFAVTVPPALVAGPRRCGRGSSSSR